MLGTARVFALLCSLIALTGLVSAQAQRNSAVPDLIGASVLAADGTVVGQVAAITMGAHGDFAEIRIAAESPLGIGQRIVIVPPNSFMVRRGAIVLDLSAAEIDALPTAQ